MRKLFPYILILVIVIGIFTPFSKTEAAGICKNFQGIALPQFQSSATCLENPKNKNTWVEVDNSTGKVTQTGGAPDSHWYDFLNPVVWFPAILSSVAFLIMKIMSLILGLAGLLLNGVLNKTIIHMTENVNGMTGINVAWKIIRDLMNIAFIFMLVYEGIKMIIGQGSSAKIKTFITGIVMASLLINFSLFFTKVMIDASNVITVGVYNSLIGDAGSTSVGYDRGLSNAYMQALGLQSAFDSINVGNGGDYYSQLAANLGAAILLLVAAFVFLAVSVLFIVRYIIIIFLLILSPVGFMGMGLPGMKKWADQWWETLWGQLIFAPLFMIMTWVVLTLISAGNFAGAPTDTSASFARTNGTINVIFNFAVIIGLSIASLIVSKQQSTKGSKMVGDLTKRATSFTGNAVMGSAARIGKNTVGRGGNWVANNENLKESAAKGGVRGFFAKQTLKTGAVAATSSFDARATSGMSSLVKQSGVDFGKAADKKKDNFQKNREDRAKKEADFAKTLKPSDDAKEKMEKEMKDSEEYQNKTKAEADAKKAHEEAVRTASETEATARDVNKAASQNVKDLEAKRSRLQRDLKEESDETKKVELKEKIDSIRDEIESEAEKAKEIKKAEESRVKSAQESVNTMKTASEGAASARKEMDDSIGKVFEKRVDDYAKIFENEAKDKMGRWKKNLAKIGGGAVLGGFTSAGNVMLGAASGGMEGAHFARTAATNREIARKITAVNKAKSPAEKAKEALREMREEDKKKGVKWDEDEEPVAPAPTPKPTTEEDGDKT